MSASALKYAESMMSESRRPCDIVAKPGDGVGQLNYVCSPLGKVRCGPRGCQHFCQVGAQLQLRF